MYIKGFDSNLCCRGMQYEIGKDYKTNAEHITEEDLCTDNVLHFCDSLQKVHKFYSVGTVRCNRFCEIEVLGDLVISDDKCGSNHIRIVREIGGEELAALKGLINGNTGLFNSGNRNSGYGNSGNRNSGDFNACNGSNGVFCTEEPKIRIFNQPSDMTLAEFRKSKYYTAICSAAFQLTEYIEYTDAEKQADEKKALIGGYLRKRGYKEACAIWWANMSEKNKQTIMSMPNFDAAIFEEITGIIV